ncbi:MULTISPECIES: helix-hairpin-helix domain-containing protein [unclassified Streptomyces]|uniref:DNA-directed DNA polymerase n=1 Tax=Streptomyces sp. F12 TaxID=1436084 RepID=V9Z9T9_9ACTN|nr:helix-hairpin-helix domain-containing protein [Streptomyces sp. F12]AHE40196.1 DNA-directed DNA polymerase [Streptomyces sp. F12]
MTPTAPLSVRRSRAIVRIHFHAQDRSQDLFEQLLAVLRDISPTVEPLPADGSAYMDLTGSLRFWNRDTAGLIAVARLRLLALYGVQSSAGAGPTRSIAAMAAAVTPPGAATIVGDSPYEVAAFLRPNPASALPGLGPKTARTLAHYGIFTVGDIADTPPATLQRILGTTFAREAQNLARGIDDRPVVSAAAPKSLTANRRLDRDQLDPDQHQRVVLALTGELGGHLRDRGEVAQAVTLTVTYADRTQTIRTRALTEPTAHTPDLAALARQLLDNLGLQRARIRAIAVRAERLRSAQDAVHQLTFDDHDEKLHRLEAVLDRARHRFRPDIIGAASTLQTANSSFIPPG